MLSLLFVSIIHDDGAIRYDDDFFRWAYVVVVISRAPKKKQTKQNHLLFVVLTVPKPG